MNEHPPAEVLGRFADGLLQPDDMATVAIHVAGCERCRKRANRDERSSSPYAGAIWRVAGRATRREKRFEKARRRASGDLARILALPTEEWNRAVRSSPRYDSYAFARRALAASKASWTDDPYRAEQLAELGLFVADRLSHVEHGRRNLNDLRSRAWARIANCRRLQTEMTTVPEALNRSLQELHRGTKSELEQVEVLSYSISFMIDMHRLDAAQELIEQSEDLCRFLRDSHQRGRLLMHRARCMKYQARLEESIELTRLAHRSITRDREPRLEIAQRIGLARNYGEAGKGGTALAILDSIERRCRVQVLDGASLHWARGTCYANVGYPEKAVESFRLARNIHKSMAIDADAALINLDLGSTLISLGRPDEAKVLALESLPVLAVRGIHHHAFEALDLFRRAGGLS